MIEQCRLCGENNGDLRNIFEENTLPFNLRLRIHINLQIIISTTDHFSHSLCQICFEKLQKLDDFIKLCQRTQFALVNVAENVSSCVGESMRADNAKRKPSVTNESVISKFSRVKDNLEDDTINISPKRHKLMPSDEDFSDAEAEEVEVNLSDYETCENEDIRIDTNDLNQSSNCSSSKKIPLSSLVSLFYSKVQVNKSESLSKNEDPLINSDSIDAPNHNFDNIIIKTEKVGCENNMKKYGIPEHILITNEREMRTKKEEKLSQRVIKCTDIVKSPKKKMFNLRTCPLCTHQFTPNEIEDHVRFHSDNEEYLNLIIEEMKEVPFKHKSHYCEECNKVFVRDSLYMEHMKEHDKIKVINCHLCDHTFLGRKKLKVHMRAVHVPKRSKCDLCSYAAKSFTDLQKHIRGVHDPQPIICEICGKSVSSNVSNYNRHLQTHSEDRPYKCELCDSCYKTSPSLQKHRENIHFPKSVMCTACGTICGSKIKYKKHLRRCRKRK